MSTPSPTHALASVLVQRMTGGILAFIAMVLIVLDAASISLPPDACSLLLFAVLVIIAFAVHKTKNGWSSLIGLFFITTVLFIAARPLVALALRNPNLYSISFGVSADVQGSSLYRLLAFWTTGISSLFGGYFLFFSKSDSHLAAWNDRHKTYCKRSFLAAFVIVAALLPIRAIKMLQAFASAGYTGLYLNQAQYSLDPLRVIDFLGPLLYALAVLIDEKRYSRIMIGTIAGYVLISAVVGQRMEAGTWLMVALWHYSTIRRKPLKAGRMFVLLVLAGCVFELMEAIRGGGVTGNPILVQFFINQGLTFLLPALSWQLPAPPLHAILGSFLPMGALYSLLGISSAETSNISSYICSQSNPIFFEAGFGLGSSVYIEVFYICGQVMVLYAAVCALLGFLLRKWEERAHRSKMGLFFLCACLSSIFSVQRGSINTITSLMVYLSAFMAATYLADSLLRVCELNLVQTKAAYGAD